jgi:hypothetical protein
MSEPICWLHLRERPLTAFDFEANRRMVMETALPLPLEDSRFKDWPVIGWVRELRLNENGSVDAKVEWLR